jgi:hypothetical protein
MNVAARRECIQLILDSNNKHHATIKRGLRLSPDASKSQLESALRSSPSGVLATLICVCGLGDGELPPPLEDDPQYLVHMRARVLDHVRGADAWKLRLVCALLGMTPRTNEYRPEALMFEQIPWVLIKADSETLETVLRHCEACAVDK